MRVPVAPFANNGITRSLCLKAEDPSRKRKLRSLDVTPVGGDGAGAADTEQLPATEPKKTKRDAAKTKKTPTAAVDKETKNTERVARKKPAKAPADQAEPKRPKAVAKKPRQETSPRADEASLSTEAAETGDTSPTSAYRPHYDSVFSR
jgi:hypothetical protein